VYLQGKKNPGTDVQAVMAFMKKVKNAKEMKIDKLVSITIFVFGCACIVVALSGYMTRINVLVGIIRLGFNFLKISFCAISLVSDWTNMGDWFIFWFVLACFIFILTYIFAFLCSFLKFSWHILMRMRAPKEGSCDPIAPLELPHSLHAVHRVSPTDELNMVVQSTLPLRTTFFFLEKCS